MNFLSKHRRFLFLLNDGIVVVISWLAAIYIRHGQLVLLPPYRTSSTYLIYLTVLEVVVLGVYYVMRVYQEFYSPIDRVVRSTVIVFLLTNLLSFYFQDFAHSRLVIIVFSSVLLLLASAWRIGFFLFNSTELGKSVFQRRTVIIGTGKDAETLCDQISILSSSPFKLYGVITTDQMNRDKFCGLPVLGSVIGLRKIIEDLGIDEIIITQDQVSPPMLWKLMAQIEQTGASIKIVPWGLEDSLAGSDLDELRSDIPAIEFLIDPISGWQKLTKRIVDVFIASLLLVLLSPLFIIIALLIKRESKGSVFYFQKRLGRHGEPFELVKFRTMKQSAEAKTGPVWAERDDARATKVGSKLRQLGIDELPQLFNIVRGEMSLVGPRPERPFFAERYHELRQRRLSVKPGITGLAQISSRYELSVEEKVRYDLYYIQNFSLSLDLVLLLRTLTIVIREELISLQKRRADG